MADGKVFSKDTVDLLVKVGDDLLEVPFYLEPFDNKAFRIVIGFINKKADKFIPDEIDKPINEAIHLGFAGEYDKAAEQLGTILNKLIDIPIISEEHEQAMFVEGVKMILHLVMDWLAKRKAKNEENTQ